MKQQTCLREFIHYTVLSILGMLGVSCYILADTFFISKGLGTNGLAALNLAIPVYNFIHGTGLMLGIGGATKFLVYKIQNKKENANQMYTNTIYLAILFSVIFFVLGLLFSGQLANTLGADKNVLEMTETYLHWLLLFSPAFILNNILLCFVRNDEHPQLAMTAMLVGSFSNILLDYIFIFPMQLGILGAVLATGLSPVISILVMLPHWLKKKNTFHLIRVCPNIHMLGQNLSLGLPSLIAQVSSGVVMITFNALLLKLEGNTGVAAYGVIANLSIVIISIYTGIAQGVQPLFCRFYGQKNDQQLQILLRYAMTLMTAVSFLLYFLIFVWAQPITSIFNSEHNESLQQIAVTGLQLYFLSNLFVGYNTILATFFTSIEKALPAQILSILRGLILIIPMAFILSALWKITGVWLAYPITELVTAGIGEVLHLRTLSTRPIE